MSQNGNCRRIDVGIDYGMILSEHRHPSIDALHFLIKSISELSEAESNHQRLDALYEEGHSLITKRLLKNY